MKNRIVFASDVALTSVLAGSATQFIYQRHEAQFLPKTWDSGALAACQLVLFQDDPLAAAKETQGYKVLLHGEAIKFAGIGVGIAVINGVSKGFYVANRYMSNESVR